MCNYSVNMTVQSHFEGITESWGIPYQMSTDKQDSRQQKSIQTGKNSEFYKQRSIFLFLILNKLSG